MSSHHLSSDGEEMEQSRGGTRFGPVDRTIRRGFVVKTPFATVQGMTLNCTGAKSPNTDDEPYT